MQLPSTESELATTLTEGTGLHCGFALDDLALALM
jgi:acid phosphatase family membrane protein YuiD